MSSWGWVLLCAGAGLGVARADVVHLQNGRRIQGEVLERGGDRVIVRSGGGRVVLPAAQVRWIERESRGGLLLAEAQRAERDGDPRAAAGFYRRALEQGEGEAGAALARLESPGGVEEGGEPRDPEQRLAGAARALARGDAVQAEREVRAALADRRTGRRLRERGAWVLGRALEARGAGEEAAAAYRGALGAIPAPRELELLRELARLRYAGFRLQAGFPGLGEGWEVVSTPRLLLVARPELARCLGEHAEATLDRVAARLELPTLSAGRRVTLFLHDDARAYHGLSGSASWAGGHASRGFATGEVARVVHLSRSMLEHGGLDHELAHVLLADAFAGHEVPRWLHEGAAGWVEPEEALAERRARSRELLRGRPWSALLEVTRESPPPCEAELETALDYYARAGVLFEALVRQLGPRAAIALALEAGDEGDLEGASRRTGRDPGLPRAASQALLGGED